MSRIDTVHEKLIELSANNSVTTEAIADALGLSRANVSSDLNQLCKEGKASKEGIRPVLYKAISSESPAAINVFDQLTQENPSLYKAIEQAKAAILYPPKGMHILILGETGAGKSMFAELIHRYAVEIRRMEPNSPLIVFNCADYANNPQLLLSQLFGAKKGSYTGADTDKAGLIEKADGGILFLDEVHRLPPEGQEMFFTFMDTGAYRRLGETDTNRTARVLLISATTEEPGSSLLKTFTRRIPMVIQIPNLQERSIEERFTLICRFLMAESARLGKPILVSVNSLKSFLSYSCPNNIGQLKTDLQLACAKAYTDFITQKHDTVKINSINLPDYIREGLYKATEHRQLWTKLIGINQRYCIFDSSQAQLLYENDEINIYDLMDQKVQDFKSKGVSTAHLEQEMEKDIAEYFSAYLQTVNQNSDFSKLERIINPNIIKVVAEVIQFSEAKLQKTFHKTVRYGMMVHIAHSIERINRNQKIIHPQLTKIRTEYNVEFATAVDCLKRLSSALDIDFPIDEAGFLAMFFIYNNDSVRKTPNKTNVLIITHGTATATSMAEVANRLSGVDYAVGINAPLDETPQQVISNVKNYIRTANLTSDILFLVDMGSFTNFGDEIEREFGIKTRTLPLVSTLHVIEATRKAMLGHSLDKVYDATLQVNEFASQQTAKPLPQPESPVTLTIVTLCTTGEGCAHLLKKILLENLKSGYLPLEIIPLSLSRNEPIKLALEKIAASRQLLCLISPFHIDCDIPQYDIDDVLNQNAFEAIQKQIDIETTYHKIGVTFENHLTKIPGQTALRDIQQFIRQIETALALRIPTNILIGIAFHLGCLIDQLKGNPEFKPTPEPRRHLPENHKLHELIRQECAFLNAKYDVTIPDAEIECIMALFDPKNFTNPG